jgi:hypothetical protein
MSFIDTFQSTPSGYIMVGYLIDDEALDAGTEFFS